MGAIADFFSQSKQSEPRSWDIDDVTRARILQSPFGIGDWFLRHDPGAITRKGGTEPNQMGVLLDIFEDNERNVWLADLAQALGATNDHTLVQVGKLSELVRDRLGLQLEVQPGPDGVRGHGRLTIASKEMLCSEVAAIKRLISTRMANIAPIVQSVMANGTSIEEIRAEFDGRRDQQVLEGCRVLGMLAAAK